MIRAKTTSLFSERSQNHNFTRSYCYVARTARTCVLLCVFFLCKFVVLWLFFSDFCCVLLFFMKFQSSDVVENLPRLSCLLLWMRILTFKLWNCILGGLHCHFCCERNLLKFCSCYTLIFFLIPAKFGKAGVILT